MWLDPGPFGTLGVGGGFALGAKLVRPDADVWLIWGDGSAGYSIMEFDSFQRHKVFPKNNYSVVFFIKSILFKKTWLINNQRIFPQKK